MDCLITNLCELRVASRVGYEPITNYFLLSSNYLPIYLPSW